MRGSCGTWVDSQLSQTGAVKTSMLWASPSTLIHSWNDVERANDGRLGKQLMKEFHTGYCLPKGLNVCLIMKETERETPKLYALKAVYDNPVTHQTEVLSGYILKSSCMHKFFHSPVYVVRVPADKDVGAEYFPLLGYLQACDSRT